MEWLAIIKHTKPGGAHPACLGKRHNGFVSLFLFGALAKNKTNAFHHTAAIPEPTVTDKKGRR